MGVGAWGRTLGNPSAPTRNKKDLAASSVSIFGGGRSAQREAEFSKFKERGVESKIFCSFWASFKDGGGVLPCTLCQIPVLGATQMAGAAGTKVQRPMVRDVGKIETVHRSPF